MLSSHRLLIPIVKLSRVIALLVLTILCVNVAIAQGDISLNKTVSAATVAVGNQVTFTVDVINEGTTTLTGIEVTDAIPANATFVTSGGAGNYDDATGIWTIASIAANTTETFTVDVVITGEGIIYNLAEVTAMDQTDDDSTPNNTDYNEDDISSACVSVPVKICPTTMETIEASVPVGGLTNIEWFRDTGAGPVAFGTGSPITISQEGEYTFIADNAAGCEAGNCCPLIVEEVCFDLAIQKRTDPTATYTPGQRPLFEIEVYNQGNVPAYNIEITDYLPSDMNFPAGNPTNMANNWALVNGNPTTTIAGPIAPGASTIVGIVLQVSTSFTGDEIVNFAEISAADDDTDGTNAPPTDIDSTPDVIDTNDAGGAADTASDDALNGDGTGAPNDTDPLTDEDDADPATVQVEQTFDLMLTKNVSLGSGPFEVGDNVGFTLTLTNQGTLPATNIEITDFLPPGLTIVTSGWSGSGPFTRIVPSVAPNITIDIQITVLIGPTFQGTSFTNVAEITADNGDDIDSTPDNGDSNEDDQGEASVTVNQTYDLALSKAITSTGPYEPGDQVTYEISVTNEGTLNAANVEVTDNLPAGLNFVSGTGFSATAPYISTIASLPAGATEVLTLVAEIDASFMGTSLVNEAEITADDGMDDDSTPDNDDPMEDDQDEVPVTIDQTYDLALAKAITSTGPYEPGDNVT